MADIADLLRRMLTIRTFEVALMARPDHGFQLLSTGEEAVAVGLCDALDQGDQLLSSGRSIGPAIARGIPLAAIAGELLGKANGTNHGMGGRGHLSCPSKGFFGAHAVVAGNLTVAAGVALAMKRTAGNNIAVCIIGDGAAAAGALHETLNLAALWRLPLLVVINNNQIAISTPSVCAVSVTDLSDLARPFGIPATTVDGIDVLEVKVAASKALAHIRSGKGPYLLECRSERFSSHSSSTRETRSHDAMARVRARCPINHLARWSEAQGQLTDAMLVQLETDVEAEVAAAFAKADAADYSSVEEALSLVW